MIRHALSLAAVGAAALVMTMPAQAANTTVTDQAGYDTALQTSMTNGVADTITVINPVGVVINSDPNVILPGDGNPLMLDFQNGSSFLVSNAGTASKLTLGSDTTINMIGDSSAPSRSRVGNNGNGELVIQDGATIHYTATNPENGFGAGGIYVGRTSGGSPPGTTANGHATMTGGSIIVDEDPVQPTGNPKPYGVFAVGLGTGATGVFDQSGGSVTVGSSAFLIGDGGGTGTYNLSNSGVVNLTGSTVYIGFVDGASSGDGTLNVTGNGQFLFNADTASGQFYLGAEAGGTGHIMQDGVNSKVVLDGLNPNKFGFNGGTGTYDLNDGTLVLGGQSGTLLGSGTTTTSKGVLNQSGGILENTSDFASPAAALVVGDNGIGEYNLSGGQATINYGLHLAEQTGSTGTVNQSGGTLTLGNNNLSSTYGQIHFGKGDATYNLTGGILQLASDGTSDPFEADSDGSYTFNLNGGTIEALNSFTTDVTLNLLADAPSTINTNEHDLTFSDLIENNSSVLNKTGSGKLTLGNGISGMSGLNIIQGNVATNDHVSDVDHLSISSESALNVSGDYTQNAGSVYEVQTDTSTGHAGLVTVSGVAHIADGKVQLASNSTFDAGDSFNILQSDNIFDGKFDSTVDTPFLYLTPTIEYDDINNPTVASLDFARNSDSFEDNGVSLNERSVANAVEGLGAGNGLYDAVLNLNTQDEAQDAFNQLSGEIHASASSMLFLNSHHLRDTLNRQMDGWGDNDSHSSFAANARSLGVYGLMPLNRSGESSSNGSHIWAQGFGNWGHLDGDNNAASLKTSTSGILVGADTPLGQNWRGGLAAGIDRTNFDVDTRNSSGDSDATHLAAYAGTQTGDLKLHFGASYSWNKINTTRRVTFSTAQNLKADYDANTLQLFGEAGYQKKHGKVTYEPFLGLAYVKVKTDGFSESGGSAALNGNSNNESTTYSTLGVRASTQSSSKLSLRGMLGWRHAFSDVTPSAYVNFAGGNSFQVNGVPIADDSLLAQLGVDYQLNAKVSLGLTYAGQFGSGNHANTIAGSINYFF